MKRLAVLLVLSLSAGALALGAIGYTRDQNAGRRLEGLSSKISSIDALVKRVVASESGAPSAKDLEDLRAELGDLKTSLDDLRKQIDAQSDLPSRFDALAKKVDALSTKVNSIDSRLTLLQTRFDDHLRKSGA